MELAAKDAVELQGKNKEVGIQYVQQENKQNYQGSREQKHQQTQSFVLDVVIHDIHQLTTNLKTLIAMAVANEVISREYVSQTNEMRGAARGTRKMFTRLKKKEV